MGPPTMVEAVVVALDTSATFALMNRRDPEHERVRAAFEKETGPFIVPAGTLAEITYLIRERLGERALDEFLRNLQIGALTLDCGENDFARIRELALGYGNLPLGVADAAVIACTERRGGRVMTLDRREFAVVAAEGSITVIP